MTPNPRDNDGRAFVLDLITREPLTREEIAKRACISVHTWDAWLTQWLRDGEPIYKTAGKPGRYRRFLD